MAADSEVGPPLGKLVRRRGPVVEWAIIHLPQLAPMVVLLAAVLFFQAASGGDFLKLNNIRNIAIELSILAVMATAMTFIMLLGEIDLSVASVAFMTGMIATLFYSGTSFEMEGVGTVSLHASQPVAIFLALVAAGLIGLANGLVTAFLRLPSFIVTLASLQIADGITFYTAKGRVLFDIPTISRQLGGTFVGQVPLVFVSAATIIVAAYLVLRFTRFGRYVYMSGSNREAANLSGINTKRIVVLTFVIGALLSGVAGLLNVGVLGSAQPTGSTDLLLPVIAAVVLGGTSLFGGVGGMFQTAIGLVLFACLQNGLDSISLNVYLKPFFSGIFLLVAIVINVNALGVATRMRRRQISVLEQEPTPAA